tara:strand:- start:2314 stop:3414 length:1101 start_codon:yes stop_codon:yes gene_type:complete
MKHLIFLFIFILVCYKSDGQTFSHRQMMEKATMIYNSPIESSEPFRQAMCNFKSIDTIYYKHSNESPVDDFFSVKGDIDLAIKRTALLANKQVYELPMNSNSKKLDLVISYEYMDGIDGTLARASYPNCDTSITQKIVFDNYDMPPGENTPDSLMVYYQNTKNISHITAHEMGHIFGLKHSDNPNSMMAPFYRTDMHWTFDEKMFFGLNFGPNNFLEIKKGDNYFVTENFNISEFFSKCAGLNKHRIDNKLIIFAQKLRDIYGSSILINSSYRYTKCNNAAGGAKRSQHLAGRALDISFLSRLAHETFINDVISKSYIIEIIKKSGIKGIGLYNSHIHIDTRRGNLVIFDKRASLKSIEYNGECEH